MVSIYESLLRLYPAEHRRQFGDEMLAVFLEARAEARDMKLISRVRFGLREIAGLMSGALLEHLHNLVGVDARLSFSTRRFAMRNGFRFPKTTAVLMIVSLAGIALAIERGRAIQVSFSNGHPPVVPLEAARFTFFPTLLLLLVMFYAVGLVGWAILFALRRSGVHRLADISGLSK